VRWEGKGEMEGEGHRDKPKQKDKFHYASWFEAGSKRQVRSWSATRFEPVSATSFEPDSVMEFGRGPASSC